MGRYTHPKVQWFDGNGNPLAGGKLYFYESGTSTPLDTFSVQALTPGLENANPVVADANGVWPDIWLKEQDYKVVLKTSADVQIWSADPVDDFGTGSGNVGDGGSSSDATARVSELVFIINGGGSAITTGIKGDIPVDFNCTINQNTLLADQSGSIVIDIWKDVYSAYPPTDADSITASAPPTITTATKSKDATLTGWTTTITAGDTLRFNVDSCTSITFVTLALKVTKT